MKRLIAVLLMAVFGIGLAAQAQEEEPITQLITPPDLASFKLTLVANGFEHPLLVTHAGDGSGRIFIVEQTGRVWVLKDGEIGGSPFLDLSDRVNQSVTQGYSELGLLGLAFHPDFAENGVMYVSYNDRSTTSVVSRIQLAENNPNVGDRSTEQVLLTLRQPYDNHNGGHIAFGPDGYLYISFGDGGAAGDPLDSGQNPSDWYGSILRIDVDSGDPYAIPEDNPHASNPSFAREVWSYGLRNVWRFSFDRATGDLYLADVGQNEWEEVNFQPADSPGGENYGWSDYEASAPYAVGTVPPGMVYPVAEYRHSAGNCSVSGGFVYRGAQLPQLKGVYFFGDFCSGQIWASWRDSAGVWQTAEAMNAGFQISAFGEDEAGEMYVVNYDGEVYRIDPVE